MVGGAGVHEGPSISVELMPEGEGFGLAFTGNSNGSLASSLEEDEELRRVGFRVS
jgi:hypothetical protein